MLTEVLLTRAELQRQPGRPSAGELLKNNVAFLYNGILLRYKELNLQEKGTVKRVKLYKLGFLLYVEVGFNIKNNIKVEDRLLWKRKENGSFVD